MFTFTRNYKVGYSIFVKTEGATETSYFSEIQSETYVSTSEIYSVIDGLITETVPEVFSKVAIAGKEYRFNQDSDNLAPGEFFYESFNNTLKINTLGNATKVRVHFLTVTTETIKTSKICLSVPSFITQWNLTGSIPVTRTLESHPTARANLIAKKSDRHLIASSLQKGKVFNLFGLPMRIKENIRWTPHATDSEKLNLTINFIGKYAPYGSPSRNRLDLENRLIGEDCDDRFVGWVNMNKFTTRQGVKYFGKPIYIFVSRNTSTERQITIRQILQRAINNGQFLYFSDSNAVVAKDWGKTPNHIFDRNKYHEILSGVSMPGTIPDLDKEYRNTKVILSQPEDLEEPNKPQITIRWKFENATSLAACQTPGKPAAVGDGFYILKIPNSDVLRDPTLAGDVSGFKKKAHKITEDRGVEIFRETKIWGWIHDSSRTYSVIDKDAVIASNDNYGQSLKEGEFKRVIFTPYKYFSFISSAWKEIETTFSVRHFSGDTGYLIQSDTNGKKLVRLIQDSSNLDAIGAQFQGLELLTKAQTVSDPEEKAKLEIQGNAYLRLAKAHQFNRVDPISKTISYQLTSFNQHYSDLNKKTKQCEDTIDEKFASLIIDSEQQRIVEDNPGSTELLPLPPLVRGKEFTEEQITTVTYAPKPGRYTITRVTSNNEGAGLNQKIEFQSSEEFIGRPDIHQRKEVTKYEPPVLSVSNIGDSRFGSSDGSAVIAQQTISEENKETTYLLNTPTSNPQGTLSSGSIRFLDVFDISLALKVAKIRISKENTKSVETLLFKTFFDPKYNEGDRFTYDFIIYKILSIAFTAKIDKPGQLTCNDFRLQLGRYLEPLVTVTRVKDNGQRGINTALGLTNALQAIDGQASYLRNLFNFFTPETIANAAALGALDALIQGLGLGLTGLEDFSEIDGIDNLLNGGFDSSSNGLGAFAINSKQDGEDGTTIDLREKTNPEKFADLINRAAFVSQLTQLLQEQLGLTLAASLENGTENATTVGGLSGAGGAGNEFNTPPLFTPLAPNVILEGGDSVLSGILNGLLGSLFSLIDLLANGLGSTGGAGGAGGAGGSGGGGGGGDPQLSGGGQPAITVGNLTIYIPEPDLVGLVNALLAMIEEAIALANAFDLSLEDVLNNLLAKANTRATSASGGSSGSFGSSGSGFNLQSPIIEYVFPQGLEPATISTIFPFEDPSQVDFEALFDALDRLILALAAMNERTLGFELPDLDFLLPGEGIVQPNNPQLGMQNSLTNTIGSGAANTITGLNPNLSSQVSQVVIDVIDITGVIGGGIGGIPEFSSNGVGFGSGGTGGGIANSGSNVGGFNNVGSISGSNATGGTAGNGAESSLTSGGTVSSSGGAVGDSFFTGNVGEFGNDGWASQGEGLGDDAIAAPGTIFSLNSVDPGYPGFDLPVINIAQEIADTTNEFVITPPNISHPPLFFGNLLIVEGTIASNFVEWELMTHVTGVNLITPYDLNLTIEFDNNYSGQFIELKVKLRGAPEIYDTILIDTIPSSVLSLDNYYNSGEVLDFPAAKVDLDTLVLRSQAGSIDGAIIATSILLGWDNPPHHAVFPVSYYTVQERLLDFSWIDVATVTLDAIEYLFDVGKVYRIVTNYEGQIRRIFSDPFSIETLPAIAQTSFRLQVYHANSGAFTPLAIENPNFFIANIIENETEIWVNQGTYYTGNTAPMMPLAIEPNLFFSSLVSENETEIWTNEGTYYTSSTASITPIAVEQSPFFST